jgi:hypothetical protein
MNLTKKGTTLTAKICLTVWNNLNHIQQNRYHNKFKDRQDQVKKEKELG